MLLDVCLVLDIWPLRSLKQHAFTVRLYYSYLAHQQLLLLNEYMPILQLIAAGHNLIQSASCLGFDRGVPQELKQHSGERGMRSRLLEKSCIAAEDRIVNQGGYKGSTEKLDLQAQMYGHRPGMRTVRHLD